MIELTPTDFVSFEDFELRGRFTGQRQGGKSAATLARIRPLNAARAHSLAELVRTRCGGAAAFNVTFRSDDSPGIVTRKLLELPPASSAGIVVSWNARTAVASEWGVFVEHWGDFCYPASDNVMVCPLDESWTLCYRHFECFQFASAR